MEINEYGVLQDILIKRESNTKYEKKKLLLSDLWGLGLKSKPNLEEKPTKWEESYTQGRSLGRRVATHI